MIRMEAIFIQSLAGQLQLKFVVSSEYTERISVMYCHTTSIFGSIKWWLTRALFLFQRCFPVSAVHPVFTAAIILLLDKTMQKEGDCKETTSCLLICLKALYGMNINWNWANRSIQAIYSLAAQWKVDLSTLNLEHEVPEENLNYYNRYSSELSGADQANVPDFQECSQVTTPLNFDEAFQPQSDVQFWLNMALLSGSSV